MDMLNPGSFNAQLRPNGLLGAGRCLSRFVQLAPKRVDFHVLVDQLLLRCTQPGPFEVVENVVRHPWTKKKMRFKRPSRSQ